MRGSFVVAAFVVVLSAILFYSRPPTTAPAQTLPKPTPTITPGKLPNKDFTRPPAKPHERTDLFFKFDQLEHTYRVPGEFAYRLTGDQYGFDDLSFIVTETHPGAGPGLHTHSTEEAHVLLEGSVQYRIGDKTFTVQAPYVAKVPAGVPHAFINVGSKPLNLIVVFASKHPTTIRIGPNPLIIAGQNKKEPQSGFVP